MTGTSVRVMPAKGTRDADADVGVLQRARLTSATLAVLDDGPPQELTVAKVITHAGVSRKTFYQLFSDIEDCFLATLEGGFARARSVASAAYAGQQEPREGVRAAVIALLEAFDEDRQLARLCLLYPMSAGGRAAARRRAVIAELAEVIALADLDVPDAGFPPMLARAVVSGLLALLCERLLTEPQRSLSELQGPVMSIIVMPFLGRRQACEELDVACRVAVRGKHLSRQEITSTADPLGGVRFRITPRTLGVLDVIQQQPGASNREIAAEVGITDQGQISKLLKRLAGLGLAVNYGQGAQQGARNEWRLTQLGEGLMRARGAS
jgi:AcrR family transcriptional regulator/DNA-binding MarR family transcriptional regulator